MSAERTTTLSGRRLVAGGGEGTAPGLQVVAVRELATALTSAFGGALCLSLAVAALLVHGVALAAPLLAVAGGAAWGLISFRRRSRSAHPDPSPLPGSAVAIAPGHPVVAVTGRVAFFAGAVAAPIAGAGHYRPLPLAAAACVAPLLFAHALAGVVPVLRAVRRRDPSEGVLYQTLSRPAQLYAARADDAG